MSYGYPGQGYGPGGGHQQHGAPQYGGGYGHQQPPPNQGYGHQQPPPNQGYGYQQPPPNQGYQQQQAPPNHGYEQYPPQQGYGQHALQQQRQYQRPPGPASHGEDRWGRPIAGHGSSRDVHAPPTGTQQFGHGAPQGYTFQYSECTGKRRALLIGVNYTRTRKNVLKGCVNDVDNLSEFLVRNHGYKREDMVILVDRDDNTPEMGLPNKGNILRAMQWLVAGAQPNDALFLHYSGHGGQTEDLDGDEEDGHDEVIYPLDFETAGHIVDDEIHHYVVKPLPAGVRLTAIFDSCHSGSVLDLPYLYSTKGVLKEPNLAKEAGQGFLEAAGHYARGDVSSALGSVFSFAKTAFKGNDAYEQTKRTKTSPADVVMWSGCKDEQTSADATIASQATGAMSHAFIDALSKKPQQSYVELLNNIRDFLQAKYSQKPQLSCSHPLDTDLLFVM